MSVEKKMFKQIQEDLKKSNPVVVSSSDSLTNIKKNLGSKYSEDLSDSDDDLSSYKLRHRKEINQLQTKKEPPKQTKDNVKDNVKKNKQSDSDSSTNKKKSKNDSDSDSDSDSGSDTSEDSEEDVEYEYTEELANKVKEYVKNDDRIRELQTELRKLNASKKAAEQDILKHLERLGETNINITGGKLRINQYESKDSLKEDIVKEALGEKIKDPKIVENIFETINEKRVANAKIQISLKRTFERGGKK